MKTELNVVGHRSRKVDAVKLVTGRATFTDDIDLRGMLHTRLVKSRHAHARIVNIDTSRAESLPGVRAVITHRDVPRVPYTSAGQSWPEQPP
jgi:putative selenate reductase molybdopterin-binding subunit